MKGKLSDILFPRRCPICDDILELYGGLICGGCAKKLPLIKGPRCLKCGRPVELEEQEICYECAKKSHSYRCGFAAMLYNEDLRKAMSDFKFNNRRDNGDFFAEILANEAKNYVGSFAPDFLTPVPVHKSKLRSRGYNQAMIIAEGVGDRLGVRVEDVLIRTKKTLPQKELDDKERLRNLREAFAVDEKNRSLVEGARILLVDDIYTTGSTVSALSEVLLSCGAREVGFLSVCIGKGA